jgi:hypothetical protein
MRYFVLDGDGRGTFDGLGGGVSSFFVWTFLAGESVVTVLCLEGELA